jgi:hypothetical protein
MQVRPKLLSNRPVSILDYDTYHYPCNVAMATIERSGE